MTSGHSNIPCGMIIVGTRTSIPRHQTTKAPSDNESVHILHQDTFDMQMVKVVILGAAGVGKTSLVRQFVFSEFAEEYAPTDTKAVYNPTVVFNEHIYSMRVVDLPVIPYFPSNSSNEWLDFRNYGLRSASAYILVFDLNDLETFQYVKSIRDQICDTRDMHSVPLFIVGNKQDMLRGRERREVAGLVKKHWKCGYVECSARHNWHVVLLFQELVRALDYADYGQKLSSYSSPRFESLHAHRDRQGHLGMIHQASACLVNSGLSTKLL